MHRMHMSPHSDETPAGGAVAAGSETIRDAVKSAGETH